MKPASFGQRATRHTSPTALVIEGEFRVEEDARPEPAVPLNIGEVPLPAAKRKTPGFWLAAAFCAAASFWFGGGHTVLAPSAPASVRSGVTLETLAVRDAAPGVVSVEAKARNASEKASTLPLLAIRLTTDAGNHLLYPLPRRNALIEPGTAERFETQIAVPTGTFRSAQAVFVE